jgi:GTP:adenosylcobinamide-phosphate guanylyltransferase
VALHAILTAGGRLPRALRGRSESPIKALLEVEGATLLERAAAAALECPAIGGIAVVGGDDVKRATPAGCDYVAEGEGVVDNIYNGFKHLGGEDHDYLIISPDLPFVADADLAAFISAVGLKCEIGFPVVSQERFLAAYPGAPNHFARLDGRRCTMGSCIFAAGPAVKKNIPLGRDLYRARKYPWRIAIMLGLPIIWSYLTGTLRTSQVEERMSLLMDSRVRGIEVDAPGLAYDVDTLENYEYAARLLREGRGEDAETAGGGS